MIRLCFIFCCLVGYVNAIGDDKPVVTVGSKIFTESYILSEIISQIIETQGEVSVNRKFGLGATGVIYEALKNGSIDIYPEYSGTVSEAILKKPELRDLSEIKVALSSYEISMTQSLGFNNTYAIATKADFAQSQHLEKISDILNVKNPRAAFSNEFMTRKDGFLGVISAYKISFSQVRSLEHSLAYEAIDKGLTDFTDVYSTDAKILKLNLKVLKDDKKYFPNYYAVILARSNFVAKYPKTWAALKNLESSLSENEMIRLNSLVDLDHKTFAEAAAVFLNKAPVQNENGVFSEIKKRTKEHLLLVSISLIASILFGIPLGILAARFRKMGQIILLVSGTLQTIPSLALLSFLIPFFGIGQLPALIALFLYGLLPIVLSTYSGLTTIDQHLLESAHALGLNSLQRLWLIELPIASIQILNGIKTSMVIGIGTATLAALIGAGGYGAPIITGLAINDVNTVLIGAIPAALMALVAQKMFDILSHYLIPRGLRN
jgi:osmoprotectant transport system permease protein